MNNVANEDIRNIIAELEAEYGIYICKNGYDYSYIIPNRDELRKKDKERYTHLLELLKSLHFLAAGEKQELIRAKLEETGEPARFLLRDQRMLFTDTTGKSFAAFAVNRQGAVRRYPHEQLPLRKSFDKAQDDLLRYAESNGLPLADAAGFTAEAAVRKKDSMF